MNTGTRLDDHKRVASAMGTRAGMWICAGSGGALSSRHNGQSMSRESEAAPPPLDEAISLEAPVPEQISSMARGWTIGAATATPMLKRNSVVTHQCSRAIDLRVFMEYEYTDVK